MDVHYLLGRKRGYLSRPVPDTAILRQRVQALEAERNMQRGTIDWHFIALLLSRCLWTEH